MTQLVLYPQFFFIFASADQVLGYSAGEMCVFFRGEAPHSAHGGQCVICLNRCNWPLMIEVCTSEFTLVSMPPIAPQAMDAGHPPTVHVQFHRVRDIMTLFCFSAVSACGVGGGSALLRPALFSIKQTAVTHYKMDASTSSFILLQTLSESLRYIFQTTGRSHFSVIILLHTTS